MTLKSASFLALLGTILLAVLVVFDFVSTIMNVVEGLVPAVKLITSLIYTIAALTLVIFFYVFHRAQA